VVGLDSPHVAAGRDTGQRRARRGGGGRSLRRAAWRRRRRRRGEYISEEAG